MEVTRLELKGFRSYSHEVIEFSPRTNLIFGNNAQGKTNILEAVYLAANGRSHRTKNDDQLIKFGREYAEILLDFKDLHRKYRVGIRIFRGGKKSVHINGVPIKKLSILMNYFNAVMFSPEDLELVKGSPQQRRRFMDAAISGLSPRYMSELAVYHKALAQKNSLLRNIRSGRAKRDMAEVWNIQLAAAGVRIMQERSGFIKGITEDCTAVHGEISNCTLALGYAPSIDESILDAPNPEAEFLNRLNEVLPREVEHGSSLAGIQRDDIKFFIDDNEAKLYASQGQQRTIVLCMKLALTEYIRARRDEYPVLLLDDIMSELDESRRSYLAGKIRDKQVLITCTDRTAAPCSRYIYVGNGRARTVLE